MTNQSFIDILIALTNGWIGFFFYWSVFLGVATAEHFLPSRRVNSAKGDRITVNFSLGFFVSLFQALPILSAYAGAIFAQGASWGIMNWLELPLWIHVAASFMLLDLAGYLFHRASHEYPILWRLHRVHHSDPHVDASTTFRSHPLSVLLFATYELAVIFLLGIAPLGVLLYALSKILVAWLSHADIAPSPIISGLIDKVIVTTAFHHQHHSSNPSETDSNYGEVLTIWDRLLSSHSPSGAAVKRYGLGNAYDSGAASLREQLTLPFKRH